MRTLTAVAVYAALLASCGSPTSELTAVPTTTAPPTTTVQIKVPDVVGESTEFAAGLLSTLGLDAVVTEVEGLRGEPGVVVKQLPLPGTAVTKRSVVVLQTPPPIPATTAATAATTAAPVTTTTTTQPPVTTTTTTQPPVTTTTTTQPEEAAPVTTTTTTQPPATTTTTQPPATTTTTTQPPATTTTIPPWSGMSHPLTGVLVDNWPSELPAIAVKIDNNDAASLPQVGLEAADIVYETQIENGVTRLLAVFHSQVPEIVGEIRSARSSDIDLISNLNMPHFAYWGHNDGVGTQIREAENAGSFVALNASAWPTNTFFYRDSICNPGCGGLLDAARLSSWVKGTPPDPVFDFGGQSASASPVAGVRWTTTNRHIDYVWDETSARWLRFQDGEPLLDANGSQLGADNVVLLYTFYTQSVADPRSPEALSTGSGGGKLFRQGTARTITWDRPTAADSWHFAESGTRKLATLVPGTTWVGLIKAGEMTILNSAETAPLLALATTISPPTEPQSPLPSEEMPSEETCHASLAEGPVRCAGIDLQG